jgi:hypothetical protein
MSRGRGDDLNAEVAEGELEAGAAGARPGVGPGVESGFCGFRRIFSEAEAGG